MYICVQLSTRKSSLMLHDWVGDNKVSKYKQLHSHFSICLVLCILSISSFLFPSFFYSLFPFISFSPSFLCSFSFFLSSLLSFSLLLSFYSLLFLLLSLIITLFLLILFLSLYSFFLTQIIINTATLVI